MKKVIVVCSLLLVACMCGICLAGSIVVDDGSYRLAQDGEHYVKWSWRARVSNTIDGPARGTLTIQLLDSGGYELDHASEYLTLEAQEAHVYTGQRSLPREVWNKVRGANYEIK